MWQLLIFLVLITPLFANLNVWIIRTIYVAKGGDYYSKQWHFAQGLIWAAIWAFCLWLDWRIALPWPAYHWLVFDGFVNTFALREYEKRGWFYVGKHSGSALDKWLSSMAHPERNAAVMKSLFFAALILISLFFKR